MANICIRSVSREACAMPYVPSQTIAQLKKAYLEKVGIDADEVKSFRLIARGACMFDLETVGAYSEVILNSAAITAVVIKK